MKRKIRCLIVIVFMLAGLIMSGPVMGSESGSEGSDSTETTKVQEMAPEPELISESASSPVRTTILWDKIYGHLSGDSGFTSIKRTEDGGFVLGGISSSADFPNGTLWLLKVNSDGDEEWSTTYRSGVAVSVDSVPFAGKGYIVAGISYPIGNGDAWVIRTDDEGKMIWDKRFGGDSADDNLFKVKTVNDGYVLAGFTSSYGSGSLDAWLLKLDKDGKEVWNRTYGGSDGDGAFAFDVCSGTDSGVNPGYVLAGFTNSFGDDDLWLVKVDANGMEEWNRSFDMGVGAVEQAFSVQCVEDGYVAAGYIHKSNRDMLLLKVDSNGEEVWNLTIGGENYDVGSCIRETSDGGYIVWGSSDSFGDGDKGYPQFLVVKVSKDGEEQWKVNYGALDYEGGYLPWGQRELDLSALEVVPGGYVLAGVKCSNMPYCKGWVVKLDYGDEKGVDDSVKVISGGKEVSEVEGTDTDAGAESKSSPGFGLLPGLAGLALIYIGYRKLRD